MILCRRADQRGSCTPEPEEASESQPGSYMAKRKDGFIAPSLSFQQARGGRGGIQPRIQDEQLKKCLDCGKGFAWPSKLIEHQRSHTGEWPYRCVYCGKSFSRKSYILKHERIHTGVKPYLCPDCECGFSRKQFLVNHRRTHTGEKPYKCAECGKSFSQRTCLVIHERAHTGEKPFQCPA